MAWGIWNKIKKGFQKVGRAIVKGAKWVNDKVIKPFKPVVKKVVGALLPGFASSAISKGVDVVSDGIDTVNDWVTSKEKKKG